MGDINFNQYTITQINDTDKELLLAYKLVLVPNKSYLNDTRALVEFKQVTFGEYPRNKVLSALDRAITECKIDHACYWAFQLLASGQASVLWDKLTGYVYKNINIANPGLPYWLLTHDMAWTRMITMKEYAKDGILQLRNNQLARNLITEMVAMACLSRKRKLDTLTLKIKEADFIIANFHAKCQVRNKIMISGLLGPNDPSEIRIAANEFCYNLVNKQLQEALYWLNWILFWEKINIKKYKVFVVQSRGIEGIQTADQKDVIWLVWSIIQQVKVKLLDAIRVSANNSGGMIAKLESQLDALWKLYLHKWKPANKMKKLPIIYWTLHMLIYPCDWQIPVIERPELFIKACAQSNLLFERIVSQCKLGFGTVTQSGPSLLDAKEEALRAQVSVNPTLTNKYGAKIIGDIGSGNGLGINVIIEDNYMIPPSVKLPAHNTDNEQEHDVSGDTQNNTKKNGRKNTAVEKDAVYSASMKKIDIVNSLDAYLL
jgi:hypothetical protein